ncbi:unnamed protein product [Litomosoides sigmodontis]|uniref:Uncharacterized protein n=1 Tax=Litomosoides sigmodontis TaxID=42156 RepID=A0A3P6TVP9_LITSI|nr:unnamed protein product [Litomosoides sigmodontis]
MPPLLQPTYPLYRSKSLEKLANDRKYAEKWPYHEFRNWSSYDDYWYDCYMGISPRSPTNKSARSMWNYPHSSWLRHRNKIYDLPSIYPSYYTTYYYRYNDNARYLFHRNYFTYYSPLNRHWLKTTNKYGNYS